MKYSDPLKSLQDQIRQRDALKTRLQKLYARQTDLRVQVGALEEIRRKEERDVRRLQGMSLKALLGRIRGKREEMLSQERREARTAAANHNAAARQLARVEEEIRRCENEFAALRGCDREYRRLMDAKRAEIAASNLPEAAKLQALEVQFEQTKQRREKIQQAIATGGRALGAAHSAMVSHGEAMVGPGPMIGTPRFMQAAESARLRSEAQLSTSSMQDAVWAFRDLLWKLKVDAKVSAMISGLGPDEDSLFYIPLLNIGRAMDDIEDNQKQIRTALDMLSTLLNETNAEYDHLRTEMDRLVLDAQL